MEELSNRLPEFINRIDEVVVFEPLQKEDLKSIVKIQLKQLEQRLNHAGIQLRIAEDALNWLAQEGYHRRIWRTSAQAVDPTKSVERIEQGDLVQCHEQGIACGH